MSGILAAKQATFALLNAWSWPGGAPTVTWGPPTKTEDTNVPTGELVYFAAAPLEVPAESLRLGRTGYNEEFDLQVVVDVWQPGDDEQACEVRADVLYEQVVAMFSEGAKTHLNGTVNQLGGWTSTRAVNPYADGWRCQITVEQFCKAVRPLS